MAKYDAQITELKNLLPNANNILIAFPTESSIDKLASGLALFLVLSASGKRVTVSCSDAIRVSQSHLFGIDHIQNNIPQTEGGNLTLTLEGVASSDNTVPALEKLDWFAKDGNLNLVFHVTAGQTFQPAKIIPKSQGSGFDLIFSIGAPNLNALGSVYTANQQVFSGVHIVNIDRDSSNTGFGQTNINDVSSSSVSEIMVNLLTDLGLVLDADSASNILAGIFEATNNLTGTTATAETYMAVASCLRVGGKKPNIAMGTSTQQAPALQPSIADLLPASPTQRGEPKPDLSQAPSLSEFTPTESGFTTPPVISIGDDHISAVSAQAPQPSPEERPLEEGVVSETIEPDWLTPKIFKGSSLG